MRLRLGVYFAFMALAFVGASAQGRLSSNEDAQRPMEAPPSANGPTTAQDRQQLLLEEAVHPVWVDFEPRFRKTICPFNGEVKYDPEIITCGDVLVPEDRTDPDSRLIKLSVMTVAATTSAPPGGTVVRLEGGPGGAGVQPIRARLYSGDEGRPYREITHSVFFDQRGTGYSEPAFCRAVPQPHQLGLSTRQGLEQHTQELRRCLAEAESRGIPLEAYNNWQNALDVRDLRRALGQERWSIFGISYGSLLGQAVMQVDGEHIRAAVLDSIVPSGADETRRRSTRAAGLADALSQIAAGCPKGNQCQAWLSDLPDRVAALAAAYDAQPLVLNNLPPERAPGGRIVLDGPLVVGFIFQLLYSQEAYPDIPVVIDVLERRDAQALTAYASTVGQSLDHVQGEGMGILIHCRGRVSTPEQLEAGATMAPELSRFFIGITRPANCSGFYETTPDPSRIETVSDVPTLVANGATDPITPPWAARSILPGLSDARYVEFAYTGHGTLLGTGECGRSILFNFLANPSGELETSCAEEIPPPDFLTSWRATPAAYAFVKEVQDGARPVVPTLSILALTAAFLAYPFAAAGRAIDARRRTHVPARFPIGRSLSWLGAAVGLGAIGLAGWLIFGWMNDHPLALPVGLPTSISWAGWLALAAAILAVAGAILAIKAFATRRHGIGTLAGGVVTALGTLGVLVFLSSIGAGPI